MSRICPERCPECPNVAIAIEVQQAVAMSAIFEHLSEGRSSMRTAQRRLIYAVQKRNPIPESLGLPLGKCHDFNRHPPIAARTSSMSIRSNPESRTFAQTCPSATVYVPHNAVEFGGTVLYFDPYIQERMAVLFSKWYTITNRIFVFTLNEWSRP